MTRMVKCGNEQCSWYGQERAAVPAQVGPDLLQAGPVVCVCGRVVTEEDGPGNYRARRVTGPPTGDVLIKEEHMIDDELYLSVRVRLPEGMPPSEQQAISHRMVEAVTAEMDDSPGQLVGVEVTFATFQQLPGPDGQVMQFAREKQQATVDQLNRDDLDGGDPDA